jgi:hypothetical protein
MLIVDARFCSLFSAAYEQRILKNDVRKYVAQKNAGHKLIFFGDATEQL